MKLYILAVVIGICGMIGAGYSSDWDPELSMTPAVGESIKVKEADIKATLLGEDGPSPSNLVLIVFRSGDARHVLMCKDFDERRTSDGNFRPTYGSLKASFGFGLGRDHGFSNSYDALVSGPANIALYNLLQSFCGERIETTGFYYCEGGEGWGPAVTIPLILNLEGVSLDDIINELNAQAKTAYEARSDADPMAGRFRDFMAVPFEYLIDTGSMTPAVLDGTKLQTVTIEGVPYTLWDESQMRLELLTALDRWFGRTE